jgi:hypothetical protein
MRVMRESGKCCANGHCLLKCQMQLLQLEDADDFEKKPKKVSIDVTTKLFFTCQSRT